MTLLPSDKFEVKGWEGNHYKVNEICAHPRCNQRSVHGHHMWPRSFLRSQPQDWVRLPDGTIIGNRIGLCLGHHEDVNGPLGGYRAKLTWAGGIMWWEMKVESRSAGAGAEISMDLPLETHWIRIGPLDPQPPVADRFILNPVIEPHGEVTYGDPPAHGHAERSEEDVCPVCGHHKKTEQPRARLERRNVKEWTINVPDDSEVGADVLDGWIEDFAIPLGASDWSARLKRYHVLCAILAWASQHRSEFIADVAEAADRRVA